MKDLDSILWPVERAGEALQTLARRSGLNPERAELPAAPTLAEEDYAFWIRANAGLLRIEVEEESASYGELPARLAQGPLLYRVGGTSKFLAMLPGGLVLGPDLSTRRVPAEVLRGAIFATGIERQRGLLKPLLDEAGKAGIGGRRLAEVERALLDEQLRTETAPGCFRLGLAAEASLVDQARAAGLPSMLLGFVTAHTAHTAAWMLSWIVVGKFALEGRFDAGWFVAWLLLLVTLVPLRMLVTWLQGRSAVVAGGVLRARLMTGALRLNPEEVLRDGCGRLMGRVLEADMLEGLALGGGFAALVATIELVIALPVLAAGAHGGLAVLACAGWLAVAAWLGRLYFERAREWTASRLAMTGDLIERMVGNRTRRAQQRREKWHDGEDQLLEDYLETSRRKDRIQALLVAAVPRGWLVIAVMILSASFVFDSHTITRQVIALAGSLLAFRAFQKIGRGASLLADAAVAWRQVRPLAAAADRRKATGMPALAVSSNRSAGRVIEAYDLAFQYPGRREAVLDGASLRIAPGDHLLLEGQSGAGKSTFASLLAGVKRPQSGMLMAGGLDIQSLGEVAWRRRVATAPQYHQNHVLTGTFLWNLLLGYDKPVTRDVMRRAWELCEELGLGDVLRRMPGGLNQMIGETGWQLSQGERSRLYIGRALLQEADLVILDESFAAVDPENLKRVVDCVRKNARSLMVIAHQ